MARRAAATPERVCAVDERGHRITFADLYGRSERVAAALAATGVHEGCVVSWQLPTWIDTLVLSGALSRLGAVQVPVPTVYRAREVGHVLRSARVSHHVVPIGWDGPDLVVLADDAGRADVGVTLVTVGRDALPEADPSHLPPYAAPPWTAVRWIFHTSGSTSAPKGALHGDQALVAAAAGYVEAVQVTADDVGCIVFPVAHVGGIVVHTVPLLTGCTNVVVDRFDAVRTVELLEREGITLPGAGPVFHQAYVAAQDARADRRLFPRARGFPGGGAAKDDGLHDRLVSRFGVGVLPSYGLTECPTAVGCPVDASDHHRRRTEGRAHRGIEVRVVDGQGSALPPGQVGEVALRGPQLFLGYTDPSLDDAAFDADGFFHTGDLGVLDDAGYLRITGRIKDIIIRKGENISATELEELLGEHPGVAEVAVFGVPDADVGERCWAAVVPAAGAVEPWDGGPGPVLSRFLAGRGLMVQKVPERWLVVDALPRNGLGKVLKAELRTRAEGQGPDDGGGPA